METTLAKGILHERRLFQTAFVADSQREGIQAFLAKRALVFRSR
jgi:enoyl-CoA hydratase